jgi:hypothetical protein
LRVLTGAYGSEGREHAGGSVGVLPRTRRRSVHDSRNPSRAPAASLRDRLRRPLTEPVCRMVRQLSGSGEGPGTGQGAAGLPEAGREMAAGTRASRCHQSGDRGNGVQDQPLRATVTATAAAAAANRCHQRPVTAHNSRTIRTNWGYVRLISGRSFDGAAPPRTWPTHYRRVPPRCPRIAINSQQSPPATTCKLEASARFGSATYAREHPRNA